MQRLPQFKPEAWRKWGNAYNDLLNKVTSMLGLDFGNMMNRGRTKEAEAINNQIHNLVDKILQDQENKQFVSTPSSGATAQAQISLDDLNRKYTDEVYKIKKLADDQARDIQTLQAGQDRPGTYKASDNKFNSAYIKEDAKALRYQASLLNNRNARAQRHRESNNIRNRASHGMRNAVKGIRNGV